jgi:LmbE family N-acetylglucosaminyl deacetylase
VLCKLSPSARDAASFEPTHRHYRPQTGLNVAVLSPHFDDAAFSLGAFIWKAGRAGHRVRVVTVFANRVDSSSPPHRWDARCGFSSGREAALCRRSEDTEACTLLGAEPIWLEFAEHAYRQAHRASDVDAAMARATADADLILVPSFPLDHPDHRLVSDAVRNSRLLSRRSVGYVEQPYAWLRAPSLPEGSDERRRCTRMLGVDAFRRSPEAWLAKRAATHAYRSQFRALGRGAHYRLATAYWIKGEQPIGLGVLAGRR